MCLPDGVVDEESVPVSDGLGGVVEELLESIAVGDGEGAEVCGFGDSEEWDVDAVGSLGDVDDEVAGAERGAGCRR